MTEKIQAKFIGNEQDELTRLMGIKFGKKYTVVVREPNWFEKFISKRGISLIAELSIKKTKYTIPYVSRYAFLNNWKIKRS